VCSKDGVVLVHPTCGPTQADDIPGYVRYQTYEVHFIFLKTIKYIENGIVYGDASKIPVSRSAVHPPIPLTAGALA
jgi:hypothetical protein